MLEWRASRRSVGKNAVRTFLGIGAAFVVGCSPSETNQPYGEYAITANQTLSLENVDGLSTSNIYVREMRIYFDGTEAFVSIKALSNARLDAYDSGGFVPYDSSYNISKSLAALRENPTFKSSNQPNDAIKKTILDNMWENRTEAAVLIVHKVPHDINLMYVFGENTTRMKDIPDLSRPGVGLGSKPAIMQAKLTFKLE